MTNLCVACLLDKENVGQIRRRVASNAMVRYDLSVVDALVKIYRHVELVGVAEGNDHWIDEVRRLRPDVVFNLTFSATPLEASVAGCLDVLGIPYTGSGPRGIALANDKVRSRQLLHYGGIRVPRFVELTPSNAVRVDLPPPLIVKPATLAGSVGIHRDSVAMTHKAVPSLARRIWRKYGVPAICEEFIVGREFRIGLIETGGVARVSAISEWVFGSSPPGWGYKTEAIRSNLRVRRARGVTRYRPQLSRAISTEFVSLARRAMKVLDVRGYATIDIRLDGRNRITVLEVNANPGLWSGGAIWSKPSFECNIKRIVRAALMRAEE
jgi:D-alanine-D-alanine ligase